MNVTENELHRFVRDVCHEEGVILLEAKSHGHGRNRIIRVVVDTEPGIMLSECQDLSRKISDLFFRKNLFGGNYRLEVTSPGVDKPLEHEYEYQRNIGRELDVEYMKDDETKRITAPLKAVKEKVIILDSKGEEIQLNRKNINRATVKLQW